MSDEVVLYSSPMSRGRVVHWMLEEAGAPYRYEMVDLETRAHKDPAYLAVNPMGKVPAIVHRGVVVTECGAICAHIADAFPAARLAPPVGSPERGAYYRWIFFGATCVEPAVIDRMLARPEVSRPSALSYGSYEDAVATLEAALRPGPFLLGQHFTAADVYVGSQVGFGLMVKALEPRPVFQAYLARVQERPAYKRFMEKNDQLLAKMKKAG
ncbi:MAG: glutathione S-transferase family protein [Gammaproteobacteria bacterium]|nr:glutathione S-transferase family protein [Gammaproteobacteria bacterium]MBV9726668.1 glutathione S-transferase family protein [Gammaproteobacteria bacterium]